MGCTVILCLLSFNLDKVTSMYKIPCFHLICGKHQDVWDVKIFFFIYGEFMFRGKTQIFGNSGEIIMKCIVLGGELEKHDYLINVILDNGPLKCLNIVIGYSMIFFKIG